MNQLVAGKTIFLMNITWKIMKDKKSLSAPNIELLESKRQNNAVHLANNTWHIGLL
jgi:hypothetical protein